MAPNGRVRSSGECLLLGVEQTCLATAATSEFDPERTISSGRQDEIEALERAGSSDRRVEVQHASAKCVQALEVEEPTIAD
jgi:hypothetical protein